MRCTPAPASSSPATAGPTIAPVWNSDWKIALEAGSSSMPTRPGSIAFRAELSIPDSAAVIAGNRNNGQSRGPRSAFSASAALHSAPIVSTTIRIFRRSMASTSEPPSSDPKISGNSCVSDTRPTTSDDRVIAYTWNGTATVVSWLPSTDTPSPVSSAR